MGVTKTVVVSYSVLVAVCALLLVTVVVVKAVDVTTTVVVTVVVRVLVVVDVLPPAVLVTVSVWVMVVVLPPPPALGEDEELGGGVDDGDEVGDGVVESAGESPLAAGAVELLSARITTFAWAAPSSAPRASASGKRIVDGKNQYSVRLCKAVTRGHIYRSGRTRGWEREKEEKKLLTAMCQASETSEWKGSVRKQVSRSRR